MPFENRLAITKKLSEAHFKLNEYATAPGIDREGIYSFWWTGPIIELEKLNRNVTLKGKKITLQERNRGEFLSEEEFHDHDMTWNINAGQDSVCLYVGKSSNIKNRINLHLEKRQSSEIWYEPFVQNKKIKTPSFQKNYLVKRTTACQFRAGFEHLYKYNNGLPLGERFKNFSISFQPIAQFEERFYIEDLAIGYYSPWFNLDCER